MKRIRELYSNARFNKKLVQSIYIITLICALLCLVIAFKGNGSKGSYIIDKKGNIVGIERASLESAEQYDLEVEIQSEEGVKSKDISIRKRAVQSEKNAKKETKKEDSAAEREAELNSIITEAELSSKKTILLPGKLSDDSKLVWRSKKESGGNYYLIAMCYLLGVGLIIYQEYKKEKNPLEDHRDDILISLPRFTNQLLLMLGAGMILSDSFTRISNSYEYIPEEDRGYFEDAIIELSRKNSDHRTSTATLIRDMASENNTKELMRIATILTENERRGSDIIESLTRESQFLWNMRRIIANEKGKSIDTKMAAPLGMLLVLLIGITMAPAILAM